MIRTLWFASLLIVSSAAVAAPPAKFLDKAMQGDNSEIRLGHVISQRGSSKEVRSFGDTLVSDHSKARAEVAGLARKLGVSPTDSVAPEARAEEAKLQHLRGLAFDREVKRYMIHDHQMDIADFEAQANGPDRRTAGVARSLLPTLRKHLRLAQSLRS